MEPGKRAANPITSRFMSRGAALVAALQRAPDLHSQWEDLMNEVWRQESFERTHPYTCSVMREAPRRED